MRVATGLQPTDADHVRRRHSLARAACLLRVRTSSSASSGKAAAPEPSGGSSASAACPAAAQRCRSRRLTEPLRQLAPRYRRPPPTLGHCRGRAERRARRCGAGSGFYSASGTISPIYSRSPRLLNNILPILPGITPGLARVPGTWDVIERACDPRTHPDATGDYDPWRRPAPKRDFILSLGFALQRANVRMLRGSSLRRRRNRAKDCFASGSRSQ